MLLWERGWANSALCELQLRGEAQRSIKVSDQSGYQEDGRSGLKISTDAVNRLKNSVDSPQVVKL